MKRKINWLGLLALLTLMLTACGGEATTATTNNPTTSLTTSSTTNPTTAAPSTNSNANTTTAASNATAGGKTDVTPAAVSVTVGKPTNTPGAKGGATMKEAATAADADIKKWQPDAVYTGIFNTLDSQIGIEPDGRSAEWNFEVVSGKAAKQSVWLVKTGADGKSSVVKNIEQDLDAETLKAKLDKTLPPVSTMIDSATVIQVLRDNKLDKSDKAIGYYLAMPQKVGEPVVINLIIYQGSKTIPVRIDMLAGKIVENVRG